MPSVESVYLRSPRPVQTLLANVASLKEWRRRYGPGFDALLRDYESRDRWTREELDAFSDAQRALALARAARTEHYQKVFRRFGAQWTDFVQREAFSQLPVTTKQELRENPESFRPRGQLPTDRIIGSSGTTGVPLKLLKDAESTQAHWAVWWRYRRWHGLDLDTPYALLGGRRIMRTGQGSPYWLHNRVGRETRYSTHHISRATAPDYVGQLNSEGTTWIHGLSSSIANLARFIVEDDLRVTARVRVVSLGAEGLLPWQADVIEQAFGPRPIHHYGLTEAAANASICPDGSLHVDEDFGYVELVGSPDEPQRIVGTPFTNEATALLRYDTGDLARALPRSCSCGRATWLLDGIDGRSDETIELPDGRLVGPRWAFRENLNVREAQIVQHSDLSLTVRVTPGPAWGEHDESAVVNALRIYVGEDIPIRVQTVESVPKTASGKLRLVVREG